MRLEELGEPRSPTRIAPYRAGYTPQQRREIEARARPRRAARRSSPPTRSSSGSTSASSTRRSASTFPGTVASLRQMWGRAGRRREGLAVYVAGKDALDQFFCRHPDEFLDRPVEAAILDHTNERIQTAHLLAAAYEAPLGGTASQPGGADDEILGDRWRERADQLVGAGQLRTAATAATCRAAPASRPARSRCAPRRSTRSPSSSAPRASCSARSRPSGRSPPSTRAPSTCTSVAPTRSRELDLEGRRAIVEPFDGDWYTQPRKETEIYIEGADRRADDRRSAPTRSSSTSARSRSPSR